MISEKVIEKIQKLHARHYSQEKIAKILKISRSTVARHLKSKQRLTGSKLTSKELSLNDLFRVGKCKRCGLIYPRPKFLPSWNCPGCKKEFKWKKCWYPKTVSK